MRVTPTCTHKHGITSFVGIDSHFKRVIFISWNALFKSNESRNTEGHAKSSSSMMLMFQTGFFYCSPGEWTHSAWLKVGSWYQELIQIHHIFSRCTQTCFSFPYEDFLCIHLFCINIRGCCGLWSTSPTRSYCWWALWSRRVKDSAWANERVKGERDGRNRWCHWMPGNLSLCVSVSVYIWPVLTLTSS